MSQDLYDTNYYRRGPAGAAAAVYAARKRLKTLVVAEKFGGQSIVSSSIGNWIGELAIRVWSCQKIQSLCRKMGIEPL